MKQTTYIQVLVTVRVYHDSKAGLQAAKAEAKENLHYESYCYGKETYSAKVVKSKFYKEPT
jgi:hypothetical protein